MDDRSDVVSVTTLRVRSGLEQSSGGANRDNRVVSSLTMRRRLSPHPQYPIANGIVSPLDDYPRNEDGGKGQMAESAFALISRVRRQTFLGHTYSFDWCINIPQPRTNR